MINRIKKLGHIKTYRNWENLGSIWTEVSSVEDDANVNDFIEVYDGRPLYLLPERLAGSDYSGGVVELANHRVFIARFECIELHGDYDYFGVALSVAWLCDPKNKETAESILETLEALENYPVIDDAVLSEVEMELSDEAWECWAKGDLINLLNKLHDIDIQIDDCDNDFYELFHEVMNSVSEYWQPDGMEMTIDLNIIAEAFDLEELEPFYGPS